MSGKDIDPTKLYTINFCCNRPHERDDRPCAQLVRPVNPVRCEILSHENNFLCLQRTDLFQD